MAFLNNFPKLCDVPKKKKMGAHAKQYREFIEDLLAYLLSFHARVFPLVPQDTVSPDLYWTRPDSLSDVGPYRRRIQQALGCR